MERRAFLALVGSTSLAGCSALDSETPTPTPSKPDSKPHDSANDGFNTASASIVSETFKPDTLAYDVTVEIELDGLNQITAIIEENSVGTQNSRKKRFTSSGQHVLRNLEPMATIRFEAEKHIYSPIGGHYVGATTNISLEPQARFRDLSFSTIPEPTTEAYSRRYEWTFRGQEMWFNLNIPTALYDYCTSRPRVNEYGFYGGDAFNDMYLKNVADQFTQQQNLSKSEQVNLAIAFVQSLKYTSDSVTAGYDEYQRYPVETLVDEGGDCEDTAILLGAILKHMGYDVRGVLLPGHMAIAVKGEDSIEGAYYEENGDRYYYIETTGEGWKVGDIPDDYRGKRAELVKLTDHPCLNFTFGTMDMEYAEDIFIYTTHNSGDAPAENIRFDLEFINRDGEIVTGKRLRKTDLPPGEQRKEMIMAPLPSEDISVKVRTSVYLDGELHAQHETPFL